LCAARSAGPRPDVDAGIAAVERALADPHPHVRDAARRALERMKIDARARASG
jgi:hypothetical protein